MGCLVFTGYSKVHVFGPAFFDFGNFFIPLSGDCFLFNLITSLNHRVMDKKILLARLLRNQYLCH